jgi:hypothetical protein
MLWFEPKANAFAANGNLSLISLPHLRGAVQLSCPAREKETLMDFDQAIAAHSAWKSKLKAYLNKPDGSLKPADIQSDQKCLLGQWIHGEAKQWIANAAYTELKTQHAKFHVAAADLVRKADAGQSVSEELALGASSDFTRLTTAVVSAIVRMREEARKAVS